jgi:1L-myo-inositol 1-phosphate cytidylyltransferase / CDP-L-myo-inositol myo-inositolphosphotransferase
VGTLTNGTVGTRAGRRHEARAAHTAGSGVAAVVLAAGEGSRLGEPSKPLATVAGATLLERTVGTLREIGIDRIIVVVGHAKEAVAEFVAARGLEVELVENDDFSAGNGSSAFAGGRVAGERFLLMMVDHLVEPDALRRVLACEGEFAVAVDTAPVSCDVDEATKVRIGDGAVVAVSRELGQFDAVDAGVFVCDRSVVETAEHALAAGDGTWNAVKRRWIEEGRRLDAVDLTGAFWIDVDTPEDARLAERLLVQRAASKPLDGVVSRHLNRPLSWRISLLLLRAGVPPTGATLAGFALTLAAAGVVALGALWTVALVLGGLLVQLASVVDGCDGELARATRRTSLRGAVLDSLLDRLGDAAILAALAVAAGISAGTLIALVAALAPVLLVPYVKAAFEAAARTPFPQARLAFGRDARLLIIAVGAVALQPVAALVVVAVLSWLEAAVRIRTALRAASRLHPDHPVRAAALG